MDHTIVCYSLTLSFSLSFSFYLYLSASIGWYVMNYAIPRSLIGRLKQKNLVLQFERASRIPWPKVHYRNFMNTTFLVKCRHTIMAQTGENMSIDSHDILSFLVLVFLHETYFNTMFPICVTRCYCDNPLCFLFLQYSTLNTSL